MRIISYLLILIIIVFGVTFATLNSQTVTINYYINQRFLPLSLLLAITLVLGYLLGMAVSLWLLVKSKMANYRLRERVSLAEKEIENLRAIPLRDQD